MLLGNPDLPRNVLGGNQAGFIVKGRQAEGSAVLRVRAWRPPR